jgi:8-oxo-dGTP diphosphatase
MKDQIRLAGCIMTNAEGGVLLLHRNTVKRTQWEIPGGKIEPSESEIDAVIREINEETCVTIEIVRLLGRHDFREDTYVMHYAWYLGKVMSGVPRIGEPDKVDGIRYFTQAELQAGRLELSPNTQNFLDAWFAAEFSLKENI